MLCRDDAATAVVDVQHVPQERVQNRDGEQTVVVPVPQIMDAIGEVTPQVVEQIVDVAAPLILEKILEIIQLVPLERIKNQIVDHIRGVLVPQIKEDIVQNLVSEQILDVLVPQIQGGVLPLTPRDRVQNRTSESGCASAPVQGGRLAPRTTGAFAESW